MDIILGLVQYFVDLGAAVMLPIVIFIVAICLGQSVGKAIKSGISIGGGFMDAGPSRSRSSNRTRKTMDRFWGWLMLI